MVDNLEVDFTVNQGHNVKNSKKGWGMCRIHTKVLLAHSSLADSGLKQTANLEYRVK